MKFTKKADLVTIDHSNIRFDTNDTLHVDWEAVHRNPDIPEDNNWIHKEIDSFFDMYDWLCEDEEGREYCVRIDTLTQVPYIWQRVTRA